MTQATHPRMAVLALSWRLIRRSSLVLWTALAGYLVIEVVSYTTAYPDAASRARLAQLGDNAAVRMLQGVPRNVDTIGGFVAWDAGWFLEWLLAVWALLTISRLLRGDEESDRASLVHAVPLSARSVTLLQVAVVSAGSIGAGGVLAAVLIGAGAPATSAGLHAAALAAFGVAATAVGALACQLVDLRKRAVAFGSGVLALGYFLRMLANGDPSRGWLRWWSPFGWMDELQPYGSPRLMALLLLLCGVLLPLAVALVLRRHRDSGGAILTFDDRRREHPLLLSSPLGLGWRVTKGALLAWALGLGVYAVLMGAMLKTLVAYVRDDPSFAATLEAFGIDTADVGAGMVAMLAGMFGLAFAIYACWRLGAARAEEESGRAELLLVRPITRARWLGGHVVLAVVSTGLLAVTGGFGLWLGSWLTGGQLSVTDSLRATFNPVPAVLVLAAVAVVLLGIRPRLTASVSASVAAAAYLLPSVGAALSWPQWVLDVSPFAHLALVPAKPYEVRSGLVMVVIAALLTGMGALAFARRDTVGA